MNVAGDQPSVPPAGWYADPADPELSERFWDGERWTEERRRVSGHRVADPADPPRRLGALQAVAVAGLVIVVFLELFNVYADGRYLAVIDDLLGGRDPSAAEIGDAEDVVDVASAALGAGYLLVGPLAFLPWFYRAYANLGRLGVARLRYGRGWAIGAWFVPILNLFRPKQIANDIDRASAPGAVVGGTVWHQRGVAGRLQWWWGTYIASGVTAALAGAAIAGATEETPVTRDDFVAALEAERGGYGLDIVSSLLGIAAVVLAMMVIRRITAHQERVIDALNADSHPPGLAEDRS